MEFDGTNTLFRDLDAPLGFQDQYIPPPNLHIPPNDMQMQPPNEQIAPTDFMSNFDPTMVTHPGATTFPAGFDPTKHPTLEIRNEATLLICPVTKKAIAFLDYQFNAPWFVSNGYLRKNPANPKLSKFCFDPHHEPYPQLKSNTFLLCICRQQSKTLHFFKYFDNQLSDVEKIRRPFLAILKRVGIQTRSCLEKV